MKTDDREIFVVDDDVSMSQAIERLLTVAGWRCRTFKSAEEFLATGGCGTAGILILDINLPGMSGLELQRHLVSLGEHPPVIFITGHDKPHGREQALRSGAVAYFTKPFAGSELIQIVRSHLSAAPVIHSPEHQ